MQDKDNGETFQPTWLGRYEIVGHLADGGMAEIVLGRIVGPSGFQRPVVIKRILPHLARQQSFVQMFLDEARIVAGIRHPNVVQVHELGNEDGFLYLVMEYLEGESLAGLMRRLRVQGESLDRTIAAYIIAEACGGLHAAHELADPSGKKQNVVHRDVSPQNIFVTYDAQVKVLDFGIAVAADRITRTETGTFKGKFEYASPEQCRGQRLDRRSDIWALGVVLYEVSTGTRLFKRAGQLDTLRAICEQPLIPPAQDVPDYPEALSNVVMRALQRKRADRYETALEMRRELLATLRGMSGSTPGGVGNAATVPIEIEPEEHLANLMRRLFADRVRDKAEMLRRVQSGSAVTHIPAVETDVTIEIPVAHSEYPSGSPSMSAGAEVVIPAPPRTGDFLPIPTLSGTVDDEAPRTKRPSLVLLGGVTAFVLLAIVAAIVFGRSSASESSAAQPQQSSSTATTEGSNAALPRPSSAPAVVATTTPAPATTEVVVHVETDPPKAHIVVAGEDRGVSPLDLKLPRGSDIVVIEVKRDGFRGVHERVVPELDQRLHITLVATAPASPHTGPAAAVGVGPTKPPPSAAASVKGTKYQRFE